MARRLLHKGRRPGAQEGRAGRGLRRRGAPPKAAGAGGGGGGGGGGAAGARRAHKGDGRGARDSQGERAPSMPAARQPGPARPRSGPVSGLGSALGPGSLSEPGSALRAQVTSAPGRGASPSGRPAAGPRSRVLLRLRAAALPHRLRPGAREGRGIRLPAPGWRGGAGPGTPTWPRVRAATCGRAPGPPRPASALKLPAPGGTTGPPSSRLFGMLREAAGPDGLLFLPAELAWPSWFVHLE